MHIKTKRLTLLLLLLPLGWACSPRSVLSEKRQLPGKAMAFYLDAGKSIEASDLIAALAQLDSAISYRRNFASFHELRGWVQEQLGAGDSAIASYQRCLEYKSFHPQVWERLGELYIQQQDFESATYYLGKTAAEHPDSGAVYLQLAEAWFRAGNYARCLDAVRVYEQRVSRPWHAPLFFWKGNAWIQLADYSAAEEALAVYCKLMPDDGAGWKLLGIARFEEQKYHEAVSSLNIAQKLLPADAEIYLYRARYFTTVDKPDVAREQLYIGLRSDPSNKLLLMELGRQQLQAGELAAARATFEGLLAADGQQWELHRFLGIIAESEALPEKALEHFQLYLQHSGKADDEIRRKITILRNAAARTAGKENK